MRSSLFGRFRENRMSRMSHPQVTRRCPRILSGGFCFGRTSAGKDWSAPAAAYLRAGFAKERWAREVRPSCVTGLWLSVRRNDHAAMQVARVPFPGPASVLMSAGQPGQGRGAPRRTNWTLERGGRAWSGIGGEQSFRQLMKMRRPGGPAAAVSESPRDQK